MKLNYIKVLILVFQMFWCVDAIQALNPSHDYKQLPNNLNMVYEAESVSTADGAMLQAWYFPASIKTTRLILMCHNGEGNMADYLQKVEAFTSFGYNVVTFDYRGFGKSSDFAIDENRYIYPDFQDDVKAMIDFCSKKSASQFDIYGWGMGAGLALGIGWNRNEIRRIIADTPFLSLEDLEKRFSTWDTPMEVPFAGYDKNFEPIYAFDLAPMVRKSASKSVLLIIGSNDTLFKVADMKMLQAKQPKIVAKDIYTVTNPGRIDNFLVDTEAYTNVVTTFLVNP
jgi:pimeloyl-ACP methyl ester carboxylesterase